jgi:hypothetical protein
MNDLSIHLTERVLPHVAVRHWVCTPPWALRYRLGFDRHACSLFVRAFTKALRRSMQHRAKDALGLRSVQDAEVGAVTVVQRTDSALRLSPHLHVVQLDGVYVRDADGSLRFHRVDGPSGYDVADVAIMTAARMSRALEMGEVDEDDSLAQEEPLLAQCYAASIQGRQALGKDAGKPLLRRIDQARQSLTAAGQHVAESQGFQVFCDHPIEAEDRKAVFALCRYLTRPPLKAERLERLSDGKLCYRMKRVFRDGTSAVVLSPVDLIARLAAMVPPPRFHLLRYSGVLAPGATARAEVVTTPSVEPPAQLHLPWPSAGTGARSIPPTPEAPRTKRTSWAQLLAKILKIDAETCPRCGGPMRIVDFVTKADDIDRILGSHQPRGPPSQVSSVGHQLRLPFL